MQGRKQEWSGMHRHTQVTFSLTSLLCNVHCAELWSDDCSYSCRFSLIWSTLATMLHLHSFLFLAIFLDMTDKPLASILCVLCSVHCEELWSDDCSYYQC